jgi:hypothetical protein
MEMAAQIKLEDWFELPIWKTAEAEDREQFLAVARAHKVFWIVGAWNEKLREWFLLYQPAYSSQEDARNTAIELGRECSDEDLDMPALVTRTWKITLAPH